MDNARGEVAAEMPSRGVVAARTAAAHELDELSQRLESAAQAGRGSPDHIERIRQELDRLRGGYGNALLGVGANLAQVVRRRLGARARRVSG